MKMKKTNCEGISKNEKQNVLSRPNHSACPPQPFNQTECRMAYGNAIYCQQLYEWFHIFPMKMEIK